MVLDCNCFFSECIHYKGIKRLTEQEESEVHFCLAFPDGIPDGIAFENEKHLEPIKNQGNNIVYSNSEKEKNKS